MLKRRFLENYFELFLAENDIVCTFAARNKCYVMKIIGRKSEIYELERLSKSGAPRARM